MSSGISIAEITAIPLSREAYAPYGRIIAADDSLPHRPANMGTAKRYNHLCNVENLRSNKANINLCVFRVSPLKQLPLEMKLLEKHQFSTQVFMPMSSDAKYLAIVCLGAEQPDLSTLAAFIVEGAAGISYFPGVWHYPMTAIDKTIDFSCIVCEDGTKDDCVVVNFESPILVKV
ncbi:MAG: ureidoglycolate lyase [Candidatus Obscuribacterales bacterium]|nr:ureidoglycolate lyase [Candidatus Obscuribacterales bacterium]